jgi:general secretion pathway protein D
MQDIVENTDSGIPGLRSIPVLGEFFSNRSQLSRKTELVIFLRATVVHDPSLEGDFAGMRNQLPTPDFMSRPNPGKVEPPLGPGDRPLR